MLYQLWDHDYDLDILGYTPEEFQRKGNRSSETGDKGGSKGLTKCSPPMW